MVSPLTPAATSIGDLIRAAMQDAGVIGIGQTPVQDEVNDAWARLQWMLQTWERKRWLVFHLKTYLLTSTGATSYTVGPGGDFDTGVGSVRPEKLERAFLRQLTQSQPNQIDYPLELLQSMEDYSRIALKTLVSFPTTVFYDSGWPLGTVYFWPVPQASIYAGAIVVREQLPNQFTALTTTIELPYEYYQAIVKNLAMQLRAKYQIPSFAGDVLPGQAKDALNVLRPANAQIARLSSPADLNRPGIYNIFSDRFY